jgi:hypothetical protein
VREDHHKQLKRKACQGVLFIAQPSALSDLFIDCDAHTGNTVGRAVLLDGHD